MKDHNSIFLNVFEFEHYIIDPIILAIVNASAHSLMFCRSNPINFDLF